MCSAGLLALGLAARHGLRGHSLRGRGLEGQGGGQGTWPRRCPCSKAAGSEAAAGSHSESQEARAAWHVPTKAARGY